jgi:uncharacterized protein HemY
MIDDFLKTPHRFLSQFATCLILLLGSVSDVVRGQDTEPNAAMRARLEARVESSPDDSGAWRMLGRLYLKSVRMSNASYLKRHQLQRFV